MTMRLDSSSKYKDRDNTYTSKHLTLEHNTVSNTRVRYQPKAVRSSSRGNQNFEAARCYKSRKHAVRLTLRTHQNFEATTHPKTRKNGSGIDKALTAVKSNLTPVKTNLTAVKSNLTKTPTKYKFHNERTPVEYKDHKVQKPYALKYKIYKVQSKEDCCRNGLPQRNTHTPYGPYNIPHMVLCTKQGPDNA